MRLMLDSVSLSCLRKISISLTMMACWIVGSFEFSDKDVFVLIFVVLGRVLCFICVPFLSEFFGYSSIRKLNSK